MKRFRFACNLHFVATSINIDDIWIEYWWLFCSRITLHLTFPLQIASRTALIVLLLLLCPFLLRCVKIALQRYCKLPMALYQNHFPYNFLMISKARCVHMKIHSKNLPIGCVGTSMWKTFLHWSSIVYLRKKELCFFPPDGFEPAHRTLDCYWLTWICSIR